MALRVEEQYGSSIGPYSDHKKDQKVRILVQSILDKVHFLETKYTFRFKDLRSIARNQLFILVKKSIITDSPEMYQEECKKLILYERSVQKKP
jgi:hypothetical protein